MSKLFRTVILLTIFSIAMGFLESAVVIYLRQLYYPLGFQFPLTPIPTNMALVEFLREAATIVMLLAIGIIAGRNFAERFSFFLFCFAVWDLIYYVVLWLFLDWPQSLFTWDILFLIPVPWVGPVLAPCITAVTMIALTLVVVYFHERNFIITINLREWIILSLGSILQVISFTMDYILYISQSGHSIWTPASREELFDEISNYIPQTFNWWIFSFGEIFILAGITSIILRHRAK